VLHREEAAAVRLAEVVEAADVLVRHLSRDAQLVVELREAGARRPGPHPPKTEGDPRSPRPGPGPKKLAPTPPPPPRDRAAGAGAVAAGDDHTRRKPAAGCSNTGTAERCRRLSDRRAGSDRQIVVRSHGRGDSTGLTRPRPCRARRGISVRTRRGCRAACAKTR